MKFVNIVLYSESPKKEYQKEMKELTSFYYKRFGDKVKTLYVKYNERDGDKKIEHINGDELSISGKESYIPGILSKTLDAFDYVSENYEYDYCIRTNISTIVNFDVLEQELIQNPINHYGGGASMVLNWKALGMEDERWFGTVFVQGTSIILSRNAIKIMCVQKDKFHYEFVDDVAIAIFAKEHLKSSYPPQMINGGMFLDVPHCIENGKHNIDILKPILSNKNIAFYRNKCLGIYNTEDRLLDLIHMKTIIEGMI